jgi:DNA-binding transcriptional LysR family regulator
VPDPDLNDLYFFVQVVDRKGFAPASRALGMPKSSLNRRIMELEARLGTRLIQRTSRSFAVTEVGQEVYRHAVGMIVEAEAAGNAVKRRLAEPSGTVRYTCSIGIARHTVDLVTRFLVMFPKISIVQCVTNRFVDVVEEGFDIAVRAHREPLADSSLVQRSLAHTPWHLFAAPAYLDRLGTPDDPTDLERHAGLALGSRGEETTWRLRSVHHQERVVPFATRLKTDDMETLKEATVAGLGIAALPRYVCRAEIQQGYLQRVLPDWTAGDNSISLLTPTRRGLLPSIRVFMDFLVVEVPKVVAA